MILPQPEPLEKYQRYPLTLTLIALNILIYVLFFSGQPDLFETQKILEPESTVVTGRLYYQYLQSLTSEQQRSRASWAGQLNPQNLAHMEILGGYALRDGEFLNQAQTLPFKGDEVAIQRWRTQVADFIKYYDEEVIYNFGLSRAHLWSWTWITYQFSHAGWIHLFSNMIFLLVIGTAVEVLIGSFGLVLLYLLGGFAGGATFLLYSGHGVIPMVGASASISALLAFYWVVESRHRIRYVYFISPFRGHNGFIYLPTFLIFPLFLLVDFSSLISSPEGIGGGVAYAAHAGGTLFGVLVGLGARHFFKVKRPLELEEPKPAA